MINFVNIKKYMLIKKIVKNIKNGDFKLKIYERLIDKEFKKRTYTKKYKFINRKKDTKELIIIVAGFQPYYWDVVLENINNANILNYDVCVCIPEGNKEFYKKIEDITYKFNWSLLISKKDLLAQVQNLAIKLHNKANVFYKFDEDIIVPKDFFIMFNESIENIKANNIYEKIGFIAPVLNINNSTFKIYLEGLGLLEDFYEKFGIIKVGNELTHKSLAFAEYMDETLTKGINQIAKQIHINNKGKYVPFSVRCSIGVIYFTRDYFNKIGGFKVDIIGAMGVEEEQVCAFGINEYTPSFCACDVACAHLGYFPQKNTCKMFFEKNMMCLKNNKS